MGRTFVGCAKRRRRVVGEWWTVGCMGRGTGRGILSMRTLRGSRRRGICFCTEGWVGLDEVDGVECFCPLFSFTSRDLKPVFVC